MRTTKHQNMLVASREWLECDQAMHNKPHACVCAHVRTCHCVCTCIGVCKWTRMCLFTCMSVDGQSVGQHNMHVYNTREAYGLFIAIWFCSRPFYFSQQAPTPHTFHDVVPPYLQMKNCNMHFRMLMRMLYPPPRFARLV